MVNPRRLLVVAACLFTVGLAGCTQAKSQTPTVGTTLGADPSVSASPAPAASPILADGRHPVYLTGLDASARTVTFDLIQFLTGDEAKKAWVKDHPEQPDGPDNDYYIVNDNPKLRTLPIATTATIKVIDMSSSTPGLKAIQLAKLPAHLSSWKDPDGGNRLWPAPYWLTVKSGQVVFMEEQFIP